MKRTLNCQEISLTLSPADSPPHSKPVSYSRLLYRRGQANTFFSQPSPDHLDDEYQSVWTKNFTYYSSIQKDDMMRVLKGKTQIFRCQSNGKKISKDPSKKTVLNEVKQNQVVGQKHLSVQKIAQQRRRKLMDRLESQDKERHQNEKKFLCKTLRLQKWLDSSKRAVF